MATVDFIAVEKIYPGGFQAIHGIDMQINDGELIVIVGPSGCGKSTLLRMVAGLETVTGGEIHIDGTTVNNLEPADRDIAMVFQNYALYPHMSVRQNMSYGLRNRGMPKDQIDQRVAEAERILELDGLLDRRPRQLSGGQRQRVAMGRAIVREPKVFLFDEPLSNLDAKLRVQMRVEIKKLQRALGTTSIYVTHDQVEAMTLADRLVVMNGGIAEQIGTPMELYEDPQSLFVAGFIGSPAMNLLDAQVTDGNIALPGGDPLPLNGNAATVPNVKLGIRPEDITLGDDANAGVPLTKITVDLVEALGADTLIHGSFANQTCTVRLAGKTQIQEGQSIPLRTTPDHLHAFNPETGRRLA